MHDNLQLPPQDNNNVPAEIVKALRERFVIELPTFFVDLIEQTRPLDELSYIVHPASAGYANNGYTHKVKLGSGQSIEINPVTKGIATLFLIEHLAQHSEITEDNLLLDADKRKSAARAITPTGYTLSFVVPEHVPPGLAAEGNKTFIRAHFERNK